MRQTDLPWLMPYAPWPRSHDPAQPSRPGLPRMARAGLGLGVLFMCFIAPRPYGNRHTKAGKSKQKQTGRHADRHTGRQADMQACK